jgi:hypothetical protein
MKASLFAAAVALIAATGLAAQQQVRVARMLELPAALRSDRTVLLSPGEYLVSEVAQTSNPVVSWEQEYDGPQLAITGVSRLTIRAPQGGAKLLAAPRYAYTITFRDCRDIRLEGLALGHTEAGECDGGVLRFEGCTGVQIQGCDMFGSGVIGMDLEDCRGVSVRDSTIRDCTYGALYAMEVQDLRMRNVRFAGNEAWPLVSLDGVRTAVLDSCTIEGNSGDGLFWAGPDCEGVALPRTTIRGNKTDTLLYEGSLEPDFSTAAFLENIFADQVQDEEYSNGYGCDEGYDEDYDEGYEGD